PPADLDHLRWEPARIGDGLRVAVESERGQFTIELTDGESLADLQPEVVVHGVLVASVQPADALEGLTREERRRLGDHVPQLEQLLVVEGSHGYVLQGGASLVDLPPG